MLFRYFSLLSLSLAADNSGVPDGFRGAITNARQTVDTLNGEMKRSDGHPTEDLVDAVITGLDSQIDNVAGTLSTGLNGVTLGVSGDIGDFLLGPFFQSVTNGVEVLISNAVGGGVDLVTQPGIRALSNSIDSLSHASQKYINTSKLDSENSKLKSLIANPQQASSSIKQSMAGATATMAQVTSSGPARAVSTSKSN